MKILSTLLNFLRPAKPVIPPVVSPVAENLATPSDFSEQSTAKPELKTPEAMLEHLMPSGREKFSLKETAAILSSDAGKPVSVRSIINGLESGALFDSRFNFSIRDKAEIKRHRVQWLTRDDVLLALLESRGPDGTEAERLGRFLAILVNFSPEALDTVIATAVATRTRKARR